MQRRTSRARAGALFATVLLGGGLLAGCAGKTTGAAGQPGGDCGTVANTPPGGSADLSTLPAGIKAGYNGYFQPVNNSAYAKFAAKPGPYTIGYSDSFSANSWRGNALARLNADAATYQQAGLVSQLRATNSNLDNNLQIQQITSMINQHVDAIIAIPGSPTAFNGVIKQAYDAGIPFITLASHVTSPYAINVDTNYFLTGAMLSAEVAKLAGGKGDVLVVNGINGAPASEALAKGYEAGFARCPNIKIAGRLEGQWSEPTAKTVTLQYLSTHPGKLAAVVNSGGMTSAILQALQQTGRQAVPVGDANPDQGSLIKLRQELPGSYAASTIPPQQSIDAALRVAIATLQGQGPKYDAIVANPPLVTGKATLDNWIQPGWTASSADQAPAPPGTPFFPADELGAYFTSPKPLPPLP
ncbi:substrate-binding domain-containing protein [Amycolatopsis alkalitolerans]|nr:substrate-binding domain-containing protein [Amycolatopsis alkalitolerans]